MQQTTAWYHTNAKSTLITFQICERLLEETQDMPNEKILHVAARLNPKMNLIKPALTGQFF